MGLRVETAAWGRPFGRYLTIENNTTRNSAGGKPLTAPRDTTEPRKSSVVSGFLNIVNAWTHRPRRQADELILDSHPRGIVGPMARHFVEAVDGESALR